MQDRFTLSADIDITNTGADTTATTNDIIPQSPHKLKQMCQQMHPYFDPKLGENKSSLESSGIDTKSAALPPKIIKITPNLCVLVGETAAIKARFIAGSPLKANSIVWLKKVITVHLSYTQRI
jgi:hypothetical protein